MCCMANIARLPLAIDLALSISRGAEDLQPFLARSTLAIPSRSIPSHVRAFISDLRVVPGARGRTAVAYYDADSVVRAKRRGGSGLRSALPGESSRHATAAILSAPNASR